MKTLATLIKLQQALVNDQRRMLVDLQNVQQRIQAEINRLNAQRADEEDVARDATPTERLTLAPYLAKLKTRLAQLTQADQDAAAAIAVAHDKLAELFETQKRYEIIRDQRAAAALAEAKRQEQLTLDETAAIIHERG